MISTFKAHMAVLPPAQKRLWEALRPSASLGLVLYGGTAIALRLGHRTSADFDFFTDKSLDRSALRKAFPFIAGATVLQDQPEAFTLIVSENDLENEHVKAELSSSPARTDKRACETSRLIPSGCKLSFFGTVGFGRVGEPEMTDDGILQVASLADLMATKVKVILQRVEAKDYQDLAAMIKADFDLAHGLAAARAMYGHDFQPSESLKAMVYFEGGDLHTLSSTEQKTLLQAASAVRDLPSVAIVARKLSIGI